MSTRLATLMFSGLLLLSTSPATAQFTSVGSDVGMFSRMPVDARGQAMGLATTVNPQGPTAFWWNPAPLPTGDDLAVSYSHAEYPFYDLLDLRAIAVRATWDRVTLGFMRSRFGGDDLPIYTAYDPEGTPTLDVHQDLYLLGASLDLMPFLTHDASPWMWTVGSNLRYYHLSAGDDAVSAVDTDLGTSAAWTVVSDAGGSLRLHATAMARNLARATMDGDSGSSAPLPRYYHFGLAVEAGFGSPARGHRPVETTLAFTTRRDFEKLLSHHDSENVGLEITVERLLSVRVGHRSSDFYGGAPWSWGFGLQYRVERWHGLQAAIDYATYDVDSWFHDEQIETWTVALGMDWR